MLLKIPIQSFSDLITNSSSEVFCTINADKNILDQIKEILEVVIKDDYNWDESAPYLKYLPIFPSRRPLIRSTPPFRCLSMIGWMEARSLARMAAMRSLWSSTIAL